MANHLIWANEFGPNLSTLSGNPLYIKIYVNGITIHLFKIKYIN